MRMLMGLMLVGLLAFPVMAQEQRLPTVEELALQNLNLRLRIMQLEADKIKEQRDRLKARMDQAKQPVKEVPSVEKKDNK